MRKSLYICDRCGEEISIPTCSIKVEATGFFSGEILLDEEYHLCSSCLDEVKSQLKKRESISNFLRQLGDKDGISESI